MIDYNMGELMEGDYWRLSPDARDVYLRMLCYGIDMGVPKAECAGMRGSLAWRLTDSLCRAGVDLVNLEGVGAYSWGFYASSSYSDEWVERVASQELMLGGLSGIVLGFERLGLPSHLLSELLSADSGQIAQDNPALRSEIGKWTEDQWFAEMGLLLADAKLAGEKGFNTRKELLVLVGKKRGFISEDLGSTALAAFIAGLSAKAQPLFREVERKVLDGECEVKE